MQDDELQKILHFYSQSCVKDAAAKAKAFDIWIKYAPIGFAKVSPDGIFREVNETVCKFLHKTPTEIIGTSFAAITPAPMDVFDLAMVKRVIDGEIDDYILPKVYDIGEKQYRFAVIHPVGFRNLDGSFEGFWCLIVPTTQTEVEKAQIRMWGKTLLPESLYTSQKKGWLVPLLKFISKYRTEVIGSSVTIAGVIYAIKEFWENQ